MIRTVHGIVSVLLVLLLLSACVMLMLKAAVPDHAWRQFVLDFAGDRVSAILVAFALSMVVVLFAYTGIPRKPRDRFLSFPREGGALTVNLRGVSSFITRLGNDFDGVTGLRAVITPRKGTMDVVLEVKIREGVQIHEVTDALTAKVRSSLMEMLGLQEVGDVSVVVKEISSLRRAHRQN